MIKLVRAVPSGIPRTMRNGLGINSSMCAVVCNNILC